jgi:hypothetical protein
MKKVRVKDLKEGDIFQTVLSSQRSIPSTSQTYFRVVDPRPKYGRIQCRMRWQEQNFNIFQDNWVYVVLSGKDQVDGATMEGFTPFTGRRIIFKQPELAL